MAVHNHSVTSVLNRELQEIGGGFEIKVTVGDGVGRSYRRQVTPGRVAALERSLKSEVGSDVVSGVTGIEIESRLKEYARDKNGQGAAEVVENWLSAAASSVKTRRTASFRGFFEEDKGEQASTVSEEDSFDDEVSTASFLLMGATFRYASLKESSRLAARLSVRGGETVAWNWTTTGHPGSWQLNFRALFVNRYDLSTSFFPCDFEDVDKRQDLNPEFPAHIDHEFSLFLNAASNTKAKLVQQDDDHRTWVAPDDGALLLVWESQSSKSSTADEEDLLALKLAKCEKEEAEAARAAARDSRAARQEGSFGERLFRAPEEASVNVKLVFQRNTINKPTSITGLHLRDRLRKAAAKLADAVQQNSAENIDTQHNHLLQRSHSTDTKNADEIARSLELAAQRLSALEDEAASANARAERFKATADLERRSNEADREAWIRERNEMNAKLKKSQDHGARLLAKVNCARTALSALLQHELSAFVPPKASSHQNSTTASFIADIESSTSLSKDDRLLLELLEEKSHNPFLGSSADPEADRDWSRAACGDEAFDSVAAAVRLAAERAASACDRARANITKLEKDKARYQHEKRVLVAELKRLRSTSDTRLSAANAEAQEARMVQRELTVRYDRLRKNYANLTRRLSRCTCDSVLAHQDDDDNQDETISEHPEDSTADNQNPVTCNDTKAPHFDNGAESNPPTPSFTPPPPASPAKSDAHSQQNDEAYRSKLALKLDSCRERQQTLQKLLDEQPEQSAHFKPLKIKLDNVIASLEAQIAAFDKDSKHQTSFSSPHDSMSSKHESSFPTPPLTTPNSSSTGGRIAAVGGPIGSFGSPQKKQLEEVSTSLSTTPTLQEGFVTL